MSSTIFILGVLPLLAFVIVDTFAGMNKALITACVFALLEAGISLYWFGEIDAVTITSVALVLVLAGVSFLFRSDVFFKFQPVVLGVVMGMMLLVSVWIGKPFFRIFIEKYGEKLDLPLAYTYLFNTEIFGKFWDLSTEYSGYALLVHAALVAFAALKLNKWWWLIIRGVGVYPLLFLASLAAIQGAKQAFMSLQM